MAFVEMRMPTWCSASQLVVLHGAITSWLLLANNSSRYCARRVHVIMLLTKLLLAGIVFGALLQYISDMA